MGGGRGGRSPHLEFGSRMTRRRQSLDEPKDKVLVLGAFRNGVSHRETAHLASPCRVSPSLLVASSVCRIGADGVRGSSAVK